MASFWTRDFVDVCRFVVGISPPAAEKINWRA
jgi:hypothetical protein